MPKRTKKPAYRIVARFSRMTSPATCYRVIHVATGLPVGDQDGPILFATKDGARCHIRELGGREIRTPTATSPPAASGAVPETSDPGDGSTRQTRPSSSGRGS